MSAKEELRIDWPDALAIHEPEGWAIYGGMETELERLSLLATGQFSEAEAWREALDYYNDMKAEEHHD